MRKDDYVPRKESVFYPWSKNLVKVSTANRARWGISAAETTDLNTSFTDYETKYLIAIDPKTRTKATVQEKNDAKKIFTVKLRSYCMGHLLHNTLVTNKDRDLLQLPIHDIKPTPVPPPKTWPVGTVDTSVHQQHTIHVTDSAEVTPRGGLPDNVHGFETWYKVGGAMPNTDEEFSYLNFSSTSLLTVNFPLDKAGVNVWYRFRWVNARNQPGPWSESIISAVIP
jgi:hypothetical protein